MRKLYRLDARKKGGLLMFVDEGIPPTKHLQSFKPPPDIQSIAAEVK